MSPHTCRQVITFTKLSTPPTISLEQLRGENDLDPKVKKKKKKKYIHMICMCTDNKDII